jgi:hypothetical protein
MRADMNKVIVERPRGYKGSETRAKRRRNDFDGPQQLGMRAGHGRPHLNENLSPLRRYLRAQIGRPWNKVYSEIASGIDRRNAVQQHVYQHIDEFIAVRVEWQNERLIDLGTRFRFFGSDNTLRQELYVDPRTGIIRCNKDYGSWRRKAVEERHKQQAEIDSKQRVLDADTHLRLIDGQWYEVKFAPLPPIVETEVNVKGRSVKRQRAETGFDVVLKASISRLSCTAEGVRRSKYAVSKRQLSRKEIKKYGV